MANAYFATNNFNYHKAVNAIQAKVQLLLIMIPSPHEDNAGQVITKKIILAKAAPREALVVKLAIFPIIIHPHPIIRPFLVISAKKATSKNLEQTPIA